MAILLPVEAKSWRGRLMYASVFVALIIGSITMIYPFAIMVSGSLRSEMDEADMDLLPRFLINEDTLARKFLEVKYNYNINEANEARGRQDFSFRVASLPEQVSEQRVADFHRFYEAADMPIHWQNLGAMEEHNKRISQRLREFRATLRQRYEGDLDALSRDLGAPLSSWLVLDMTTPDWMDMRFNFDPVPTYELYFQMLEDAPVAERWALSLSSRYLAMVVYPEYGRTTTEVYNEAHSRPLADYGDFRLPSRIPGDDQPQMREHWKYFVSQLLNASFIVLDDVDDEVFRDYLRGNYQSIEQLNRVWGTRHADFDDIQLPDGRTWLVGGQRGDYRDFLDEQPYENKRLVGPEYEWTQWLRDEYGSIEAVNQAHGSNHADFSDIRMPWLEVEYQYALAHAGSLRWQYAVRNFVNVFDELIFQGRAFFNTVVFVSLAIMFSLLLNPMAAYAMSRFKLPGTFKFLLILMATISFPPMVAFIPQFIALRNLDLLNTFVALLMPTLVNGYLIFLLKGFFDSLPQELYEAASIDGASEVRMFFQITMSLSKPILAVVALSAFNQAYMMFLYALMVTPDEEMWILSVWLYQYQQEASTAAVFASVLIASIPTLVVFLVVQRTIMRGIAVPSEK
ncbi:ABC transporter permease subunit [Phycisphaerales bacterium AB-hyl4]|uniref:ABC transporter permease subunit n=1 Tax=Natronomicrosphaera hydrolytica TaxID=3242702 RepID=A0ABV4U6D2_9BACT